MIVVGRHQHRELGLREYALDEVESTMQRLSQGRTPAG
jgi:hypothetical protein